MNWGLLTQEWSSMPHMAWQVLTTWQTLAGLVVGGFLGIAAGLLPGITAVMAMTLMLGFVFKVPLDVGMGLLIGIYAGAIYGGSVTAILLNIPGTPAAAATVLDGHAMARKGKAREAIGIATWSSFFGEVSGEVVAFAVLPFVAMIAMQLGDWEIFLVCVIGMTLAGALSAKNPIKGWIAAFAGFLVSLIGTDPIWGTFRYGYSPNLMRGIQFVPVLIGLFGLSEVFWVLRAKVPYKLTQKPGRMIAKLSAFRGHVKTVVRSVFVGIGMGIVPGVGESVACWLAYDRAQKASKRPEEFGTGIPEGVIAPETANNATSGGALIPMLTLGIPGSGPTAVLLAALMMDGIRPGPLLMVQDPGFVAKIIVLFWVSALVFRVLAWLFSSFFIRLLSVRREVILPVAVGLGVVGAWGVGFTTFDVVVMFVFGVVGFLMRLREYPMAPMVLGVLLGPIADLSLRRALMTYSGNLFGMFERPIGLILIAFLVFVLYTQFRGRNKKSTPDAASQARGRGGPSE